jgi:hypothetical protein
MAARTQIIGAVGVVLVLILIVELVRRQELRTGYSILWLFGGLAAAVLVISDDVLVMLSDLLGIRSPRSLLFTAGIVAALLISLEQSLTLTRLWRQNKDLAVDHALLQWRLRQVEARLEETEEELADLADLRHGSLPQGLFEGGELPAADEEESLAHAYGH